MKHKKGDRIEYKEKGKMEYAVVTKGGAKNIKAILDGGEREVSGHPSLFEPSNHPLPKDLVPSPMDKYGVSGYKEQMGHDDSQPFACNITKNGKKIMTASDSGHGGDIDFRSPGCGYSVSAEGKQFFKDVKAWAIQFGNNGYDVAGCWIDWYVYKRPFGVTAQKYWDDYKKLLVS